ncbi:MAG: J domain-containing protein [Nostoc sp. NMS7]|uniref:J domain-containing protein n=1 Tax=Nostoc sp. NMS7 TaxID=2815391 RepID=UPI0025F0E9E4|nr:J domain-containing protein [Nostoc sp. NMS7]MBN3951900.1 J domain-containing protein [Nostoc sp. NMS7]
MLITAYPLTWPPTSQRTPNNKRASASYRTGFAKARDDLLNELRLSGADSVIISSGIPLRKDGLPCASFREPLDPGIVVYFRGKGQSYALCCDAWDRVKDNLRAIGEYVSALRAILNCRVSPLQPILAKHKIEDYVLQRPDVQSESAKKQRASSSSNSNKKRSQKRQKQQRQKTWEEAKKTNSTSSSTSSEWRQVLGVTRDADFATVRAAYRGAARVYHPDGGIYPNSEKMKAINLAFEQAKLEYGK